MALAGPSLAGAAPKPAVVTVQTVTVGEPGNPSVAIVPFTDAVYQSCAEAPQTTPGCQLVGGVDYRYGIGQLEITVKQWVAFLNTVDPTGRDRHHLYNPTEGSSAWPKYGQINMSSRARKGRHYSVAYPEWADKPYGFANFLRAARFVNSLFNGRLLSKRPSAPGASMYVSYRVRLSRQTERGMYDLARHKRKGATRAHKKGFVVPSQNEWIKAAYYDPSGGGTYSYWKYPTNAGVFGDDTATAPSPTTLDPSTGDVTNAATQPLANYHASGVPAPTWCPAAVQPPTTARASTRSGSTPRPTPSSTRAASARRSGEDHLALGHPRPGRQRGRVDRHDHPAPVGQERWAGMAAAARRHRQRPRLPAVAFGDRAAAPEQRVLRPHLSVARLPRRRARQTEGG